MAFVITQIALLVLLAGAGGAAIAYWWVRRQFEDVTEEVEHLRAEKRARDLAPVLEAIEGLSATDLGPVLEAIERLGQRLEPPASGPAEASSVEAASNLLSEASYGEPDHLEQIRGVGPKLAELLREVGVYYFWQIAEWTQADVEAVDARLESFKGRIERDSWIDQAKRLSSGRPSSEIKPTS